MKRPLLILALLFSSIFPLSAQTRLGTVPRSINRVIHRCDRRVQAELPISIHQDNLWEALTGWPETAIFAGGRTYTRPIEVLVALVALFETGEIALQMIVGDV